MDGEVEDLEWDPLLEYTLNSDIHLTLNIEEPEWDDYQPGWTDDDIPSPSLLSLAPSTVSNTTKPPLKTKTRSSKDEKETKCQPLKRSSSFQSCNSFWSADSYDSSVDTSHWGSSLDELPSETKVILKRIYDMQFRFTKPKRRTDKRSIKLNSVSVVSSGGNKEEVVTIKSKENHTQSGQISEKNERCRSWINEHSCIVTQKADVKGSDLSLLSIPSAGTEAKSLDKDSLCSSSTDGSYETAGTSSLPSTARSSEPPSEDYETADTHISDQDSNPESLSLHLSGSLQFSEQGTDYPYGVDFGGSDQYNTLCPDRLVYPWYAVYRYYNLNADLENEADHCRNQTSNREETADDGEQMMHGYIIGGDNNRNFSWDLEEREDKTTCTLRQVQSMTEARKGGSTKPYTPLIRPLYRTASDDLPTRKLHMLCHPRDGEDPSSWDDIRDQKNSSVSKSRNATQVQSDEIYTPGSPIPSQDSKEEQAPALTDSVQNEITDTFIKGFDELLEQRNAIMALKKDLQKSVEKVLEKLERNDASSLEDGNEDPTSHIHRCASRENLLQDVEEKSENSSVLCEQPLDYESINDVDVFSESEQEISGEKQNEITFGEHPESKERKQDEHESSLVAAQNIRPGSGYESEFDGLITQYVDAIVSTSTEIYKDEMNKLSSTSGTFGDVMLHDSYHASEQVNLNIIEKTSEVDCDEIFSCPDDFEFPENERLADMEQVADGKLLGPLIAASASDKEMLLDTTHVSEHSLNVIHLDCEQIVCCPDEADENIRLHVSDGKLEAYADFDLNQTVTEFLEAVIKESGIRYAIEIGAEDKLSGENEEDLFGVYGEQTKDEKPECIESYTQTEEQNLPLMKSTLTSTEQIGREWIGGPFDDSLIEARAAKILVDALRKATDQYAEEIAKVEMLDLEVETENQPDESTLQSEDSDMPATQHIGMDILLALRNDTSQPARAEPECDKKEEKDSKMQNDLYPNSTVTTKLVIREDVDKKSEPAVLSAVAAGVVHSIVTQACSEITQEVEKSRISNNTKNKRKNIKRKSKEKIEPCPALQIGLRRINACVNTDTQEVDKHDASVSDPECNHVTTSVTHPADTITRMSDHQELLQPVFKYLSQNADVSPTSTGDQPASDLYMTPRQDLGDPCSAHGAPGTPGRVQQLVSFFQEERTDSGCYCAACDDVHRALQRSPRLNSDVSAKYPTDNAFLSDPESPRRKASPRERLLELFEEESISTEYGKNVAFDMTESRFQAEPVKAEAKGSGGSSPIYIPPLNLSFVDSDIESDSERDTISHQGEQTTSNVADIGLNHSGGGANTSKQLISGDLTTDVVCPSAAGSNTHHCSTAWWSRVDKDFSKVCCVHCKHRNRFN